MCENADVVFLLILRRTFDGRGVSQELGLLDVLGGELGAIRRGVAEGELRHLEVLARQELEPHHVHLYQKNRRFIYYINV